MTVRPTVGTYYSGKCVERPAEEALTITIIAYPAPSRPLVVTSMMDRDLSEVI